MRNPRRAGLTTVGVLAVTMSISAQQAPTPRPAATAHPQSVKVTGCVERATATAAAGRPSSNEAMFILTMAQLVPSSTLTAPSIATGQAAPARVPPMRAAERDTPMTFRLDGDEAMIAPHVGHKVEISGEIVESVAPAVAASNPVVGDTPAARPVEPTEESPRVSPRMQVLEITMLAMTCS